jgi:hypothetical protein
MGSVKVVSAFSASDGTRNKKKKSKSRAVMETVTGYSEASTIHGISYIFDRSQGGAARFAWLVIVIGFALLGIYWSVEVLTQLLYSLVDPDYISFTV